MNPRPSPPLDALAAHVLNRTSPSTCRSSARSSARSRPRASTSSRTQSPSSKPLGCININKHILYSHRVATPTALLVLSWVGSTSCSDVGARTNPLPGCRLARADAPSGRVYKDLPYKEMGCAATMTSTVRCYHDVALADADLHRVNSQSDIHSVVPP